MAGTYPLAETYHGKELAATMPAITTRAAELVHSETGLNGAGVPEVLVTTRAQWAERNLASFAHLLAPLEARIEERPQQVEDRSEFGHWEGDTVMGRDGRHCILTLVERKTLKLRIRKLPARQAKEVNRVLSEKLGAEGKLEIKSVTLDNGTEFHGHAQLEQRYGTKFYFARPYHSWERGTNENTNGLIRQYLPKGTCFKDLTDRQCQEIEDALNSRPRKKLAFSTPDEAYDDEQCCA